MIEGIKEQIKALDKEIKALDNKENLTELEADYMLELSYKRMHLAQKIYSSVPTKKENLSSMLWTRLTENEEAMLKYFAKATDRTKASAARMLIREGLANHIDEIFED